MSDIIIWYVMHLSSSPESDVVRIIIDPHLFDSIDQVKNALSSIGYSVHVERTPVAPTLDHDEWAKALIIRAYMMDKIRSGQKPSPKQHITSSYKNMIS